MSHLDEGTLHALLDGELDLHEVKEIQAHIGSCTACGTRLREVKEFHGESDRLVGVLEMPTRPSRRTALPPDGEPDLESGVAVEQETAGPLRPARRAPRTSGPAAEPPPLLLPENPDYGRGGLMRRMRWAALILVTVGAGYLANQMRPSAAYQFDGSTLSDGSADSGFGPVLSSEEAVPRADLDLPDTSAATDPKSAAVPKRVAPRVQTPSPPRGGAVTARRTAPAEKAANEEGNPPEAVAAVGERSEPSTDDFAEDQPDPSQDEADVRSEAARALRELDRDRQADRAAAATAALDSARRRDALMRQTAAASPAPAPRTPEQRAQTYLRIGLDEAAKQLGRPVHVIEGMSPLFMGLARGGTSPGADAARPVVRVVYQDSQGRLIFLDQQRLRPGQGTASPGADPHWTAGEISLHLSGEVGVEVLRRLRTRVR